MINRNVKAWSNVPLRRRYRPGTGTLDLLVSFTLLVTAISVSTPLIVRHGRLLKSHRNYRIALDELSNRLDQLTALPTDNLPNEVGQLTPSEFLKERLPRAKLSGELQPAEFGTRITLKLAWNETDRPSASVSLTAWVATPTPQSDKEPVEVNSP